MQNNDSSPMYFHPQIIWSDFSLECVKNTKEKISFPTASPNHKIFRLDNFLLFPRSPSISNSSLICYYKELIGLRVLKIHTQDAHFADINIPTFHRQNMETLLHFLHHPIPRIIVRLHLTVISLHWAIRMSTVHCRIFQGLIPFEEDH